MRKKLKNRSLCGHVFVHALSTLYSTQGPGALAASLSGVHYSPLREAPQSEISRILQAIRKNKSLHANISLVVNQQLNLHVL